MVSGYLFVAADFFIRSLIPAAAAENESHFVSVLIGGLVPVAI
jgi:hypothetical protein